MAAGANIENVAMRLHLVDYVLWCTSPAIMVLIAGAMYRRRLYKEFPYFFNYVLFQVISFVVQISLHRWDNWFYVYWTFTALSVVVSFAVLLEIFKDAFRPYEALRELSVILFRWCALVVLLVAGMWAITSWRSDQVDNITNAIYLVDRSVRMMQCGMVLFMLLFSEYLGISRRNVLFGIAVGFGIYAAVNMLVMTALTHHSFLSTLSLNRLNGSAYILSTLVWLAYTALPATARGGAKELDRAVVSTQKWDHALDDARNSAPPVSVLDTMDQTVERLLYRRGSQVSATVTGRR